MPTCKSRAAFIAMAAWVLLLGILLVFPRPVSALVILIDFSATPGDGEVALQWETEGEIDATGFIIQRSLSPDRSYQPISEFIASEGFSHMGSTYTFVDTTVTNGVTYYYQLEAIDVASDSELFGPVTALPQSSTQATTAAGTPVPTVSGTPGSPTPLPVTEQSVPALATVSPAQDGDGQDQAAPRILPSPTATLIPLPEVTYQFPIAQSIVTQTPSINRSISDKYDLLEKPSLGLLALMGAFWMGLGGYFFFVMRRV